MMKLVKKKKEINTDTLESNLDVLKAKIRIKILQELKQSSQPLKYSDLAKKLNLVSKSSNLSYHLNELKRFEYIGNNNQGYFITAFGEKILEPIEKITSIIQSKKSKLIIRTSKYTFIPFDVNKIEENLVQEANIPLDLAKKIAIETKKRLELAKVKYLTAPLIREYINAILIEDGYEAYRHKLTRLGLPPFDISKMLNTGKNSSKDQIFHSIGRSTIEQYVLLNLLNQKQADSLLSASLFLTNLSLFGISPLELIISGTHLISWIKLFYIYEKSTQYRIENGITSQNSEKAPNSVPNKTPKDISTISLPFKEFKSISIKLLEFLTQLFPVGFNIIRFDQFLSKFLHDYSKEQFQELCYDVLSKNSYIHGITLQVSCNANVAELDFLFQFYINSLSNPIDEWSKLPKLVVHISKEKEKEFITKIEQHKITPLMNQLFFLVINHHVDLDLYSKWGNPDTQHIFSSILGSCSFNSTLEIQPTIFIEKIGINLLQIALENQNDRVKFLSNLEKIVLQTVDFFETKLKVLSRFLSNSYIWQKFTSVFLNNNDPLEDFKEIPNYKNSTKLLCGITFYGLDECIFALTKLNIKDIVQNRLFAQEILDFINRLIEKQNKKLDSSLQFILTEPHVHQSILDPHDEYLQQINVLYQNLKKNNLEHYSFITQFPKTSIKIQNLFSINEEIDNNKFLIISVNPLLSGDSILNVSDEILNLMMSFFKSKFIHMSISRIYHVPENKTAWKPLNTSEIYTRYFSQYVKIEENNNRIWSKLSQRQDFVIFESKKVEDLVN